MAFNQSQNYKRMIKITETDKEFLVTFPYSDWMVRSLKQALPQFGRKFIPGKKHWVIKLNHRYELFAWASPYKYTIVQDKDEPIEIGEIPPMPELEVELPIRSDVKKMMPFQGQGVAYALNHNQTFIADEPGLGKTVQAIATVEALQRKCILIICPATLRTNWKTEIEQIWTRKKAIIMNEKVRATWHTFHRHGMVNYFICNFEGLKKMFVEKIVIPEGENFQVKHIKFRPNIELFDAVIIDESHKCKDGSRQQSKFVMGLTEGKQVVLALTGTPLVNSPEDLIAQLHIIGKLKDFGGYKHFMARYCAKKKIPGVLKELNYLLHKHCFYRRLKKDVLKDLPAKMRNVVRCDITNMEEYQKAENNLRGYLKENLGKTEQEITKSMRGEVMVQIGILKKIAANGKLNFVIDHISSVLESGEKFGLFAWHTEIIHAVKEHFPHALTITGDDSMEDRDRAVQLFQNNPKFNLIICNIKSGGEGLTLTAASRMGFIEKPWHPAGCEQCEDRFHRIGTVDSVECNYFLGYQTIDEDLYEIIEKKRKIVGDAIGSDEEITYNMVDEFIHLFKQKV